MLAWRRRPDGPLYPPLPDFLFKVGNGEEALGSLEMSKGPGGGIAPLYPGEGSEAGGAGDPHMAKGDPGGGPAPVYPGGSAGDEEGRISRFGTHPEGPLAPLYRFWRPVLTADAAVAGLYFPWWQERAW